VPRRVILLHVNGPCSGITSDELIARRTVIAAAYPPVDRRSAGSFRSGTFRFFCTLILKGRASRPLFRSDTVNESGLIIVIMIIWLLGIIPLARAAPSSRHPIIRSIVGVLAAFAATPFVLESLSILQRLASSQDLQSGWGQIQPVGFGYILIGLVGYEWLFEVLPLALVGAWIGSLFRLRNPLIFSAAGAILAACYVLVKNNWIQFGDFGVLSVVCVSGAVCGWIYWRIAISGSSPVAVT
jgi:hypothetical protein